MSFHNTGILCRVGFTHRCILIRLLYVAEEVRVFGETQGRHFIIFFNSVRGGKLLL